MAATVQCCYSLDSNAIDPSTYLMTPTVTQGEHEVELRAGVGSGKAGTQSARAAGVGFGLGVTQRWFSEVSVHYARVGANPTGFDALDWENIVQLAEPGQWPVDLGIATELELPRDAAEGKGVKLGLLMQKEFGFSQANLNLVLTRHFQGTEFPTTTLSYQGQLKYRYSEPFEFGVQAFGNLGALDHWAPARLQAHRVGPVVLGKIPLRNERAFHYELGLLLGTGGRSPPLTLRAQLEYEF
jgi:hypothetical protein